MVDVYVPMDILKTHRLRIVLSVRALVKHVQVRMNVIVALINNIEYSMLLTDLVTVSVDMRIWES